MTAATREHLRQAIDAATRARIDWQAESRCAGCGIELYDEDGKPQYASRCRTCADRRCKHRARSMSPQLVLVEVQS